MVTTNVPLGRAESLRKASAQFAAGVLLDLIRFAREALARDGKVSPELWAALDRALDAMLAVL